MICVYPADCKDFSNNGLGIVLPQSCSVTETLNGEWELTLIHPMCFIILRSITCDGPVAFNALPNRQERFHSVPYSHPARF